MTSHSGDSIDLRVAQPEDATQITSLLIEAEADFYEFLFDGVVPKGELLPFLKWMVSADEGPFGWQNYLIAEMDGHFAGFVNAIPAKSVRDQDPGPVPQERWDHIAPILEMMDLESFFLNSIAVLPSDRGRGVGQALLKGIFTKAKNLCFQNVTLQVWEGNDRARRLYEWNGFAVVRTAILAPNSMLSETRRLLMQCKLAEI